MEILAAQGQGERNYGEATTVGVAYFSVNLLVTPKQVLVHLLIAVKN